MATSLSDLFVIYDTTTDNIDIDSVDNQRTIGWGSIPLWHARQGAARPVDSVSSVRRLVDSESDQSHYIYK